ncbi:MAG: hypothetical protein WBS14_15330 [Rhodomicrobium sp.]
MAWLRGFALFALLVAVPLLLEQLFGRHPMARHIKVGGSFWEDALSYSGFGLLVLLPVGFLVVLMVYLPQTYQISEWLTLAERDMNALLRGWGGGYSNRKDVVKERADWLTMIPDSDPAALADVYKEFFNLNQEDLKSGGSQGGAMGKARMTAFLLRELYEGNVKNAQLKIFNEVANGGKPYVAPGIRQIVGYDKFDEKKGFPPGAGIGWFPLLLTVKLNRYPRNIIMVRSDKSVAYNRTVIDELNRQLAPVSA